jgi:hypothetical protein
MAFRIHESVVRGQIDNRVKGIVKGEIWLEGRAEPIVLDLKGNAWPDLAGCLLNFTNSGKRRCDAQAAALAALQRGTIGDLTASRKVRVFDVPVEEAFAMCKRKEKPPEHMANSLYLEWFSDFNGRVVVESADYEMTISPPRWRMTKEDEQDRAKMAAEGMAGFMRLLTEAIEVHQRGQKNPEDDWDEYDYEQFFKECDARTDKYGELLDKYGHSDEAEEKIAEEMGWNRNQDEPDDGRMSVEEINASCEAAMKEREPEPDPHREGIDWIRTDDGDIRHPLQHRCFESGLRFWNRMKRLGLADFEDKDLGQFLCEFQTTGAKLAGALNSFARGSGMSEAAFTVAALKRALDHLHKSMAGLEAASGRKLLPASVMGEARKELLEIREGILQLMQAFRRQ